MTPPRSPQSPVVQHTAKDIRRMMREQAKRYFNSTPGDVLKKLRAGKLPKTAAAANLEMLAGLLSNNE